MKLNTRINLNTFVFALIFLFFGSWLFFINYRMSWLSHFDLAWGEFVGGAQDAMYPGNIVAWSYFEISLLLSLLIMLRPFIIERVDNLLRFSFRKIQEKVRKKSKIHPVNEESSIDLFYIFARGIWFLLFFASLMAYIPYRGYIQGEKNAAKLVSKLDASLVKTQNNKSEKRQFFTYYLPAILEDNHFRSSNVSATKKEYHGFMVASTTKQVALYTKEKGILVLPWSDVQIRQ